MMAFKFTGLSHPSLANGLDRRLGEASLFWTLQAAGWLAFGTVMAGWALAYWPLSVAVFNKVLLVALGIFISLILREAYRGIRRRGWPATRCGLAVLATSFSAAPLWYEAHIALFKASCSAIAATWPRSSMAIGCARPIILRWLVPTETWLFYGFVLVTWSLLYFVVDGIHALRRESARAARADALAADARLKTLQAQLEPHFLFNTLNSISTLVTAGRTVPATAMIAELSEFLRATLAAREKPENSVGEELDFIRRYLRIQECRFGDRLRVVFDVDPAVLSAQVPTLLLQPLVENAIRHGILPKAEGGCVWIRAARHARELILAVEDDGIGLPEDAETTAGVGLANTRLRLQALYGDAARLRIGDAPAGGAVVSIELPLTQPAAQGQSA
jgi:signal transduction histidine kinase